MSLATNLRLSTSGSWSLGALMLMLAGCLESGKQSPITEPVPCERDIDCAESEHCVGGYCTEASPADGDSGPTRKPSMVLLTDSVRFLDVGRGRTQTQPVRLLNQGDDNLNIDRLDVTGDSGRVSVSPKPDGFVLVIPPDGEFDLTVSFTGSDGVAFTAALTVGSNDPVRPRLTLPVSVEYTGRPLLVVTEEPGGQHAESLAGATLDLGSVPAGLRPVHRLYVKNLGVGGMFAVMEPPTIAGDARFSVVTLPDPDGDGRYRLGRFDAFCAGVVDCVVAGGECVDHVCRSGEILEEGLVLELTVDLPIGDASSAELRIPYASPNSGASDEARVYLLARGVVADLFLEPASIDFGAVSVGFPESAVVRVRNLTAAPLDIARVALSGPGAAPPTPTLSAQLLHDSPPFSLDSFDAVTVRIDFVSALDRLGDMEAQLEVETAARPGEPYVVAVYGRARLGPTLVTAPLLGLDAGVTHIRRPALTTLVVENAADPAADPLHFTNAHGDVVSSMGAITVSPPVDSIELAPGASAVVTVGCRPDLVGILTGTLTLESDAPDNPVRRLSVRCRGIDPTIRVRYQSRDAQGDVTLDFGDAHPCRSNPGLYPSPCLDIGELYLGGSRSAALIVDNGGVGPLTVRSATLLPSDGRFSLAASWPIVVPEGGEESLAVTYIGGATEETAVTTLVFDHDDDDATLGPLTLIASTAACDGSLRDCHSIAECTAEQTRDACCRAFDDPLACGPSCAPCPAESHTRRSCVSDVCTYACLAGWRDLNGNGDGTGGPLDDGCEYACTATRDGVEACDGLDNDCDGRVDNGLSLADPGGEEAPDTCSPGSTAGFLGWFSEADLGTLSASGGSLRELADYPGRLYRPDPLQSAGDVDWLRLVFAEVDACAAIGFRLEASLWPPAGARYELCGRLRDSAGYPAFTLTCDEVGGVPVFDQCVVIDGGAEATLGFEWPETCGVADDRVLDLRVRAATDATVSGVFSCQTYDLEVSGASLY